jgi:hypothetical protein
VPKPTLWPPFAVFVFDARRDCLIPHGFSPQEELTIGSLTRNAIDAAHAEEAAKAIAPITERLQAVTASPYKESKAKGLLSWL